MKRVETYRWKTLWAGKMSPTRYHASQEDIRKEHPEAVRIEGTLIVRMLPETPEDLAANALSMQTHPRAIRLHPDGTVKKAWE